jgi:hypothetical protein
MDRIEKKSLRLIVGGVLSLSLVSACGMEHKEPAPLVGEIKGEALKAPGYTPAAANPAAAKDSTAYIEKTFQALIGELPAMGWIVPPSTLVAVDSRRDVFAFGPPPGFVHASSPKTLTTAARDSLRRATAVACEATGPADDVSLYRWPAGLEESEAVLVVSRAFKDSVESGLRSPKLTTVQLADGRKAADPGVPVRWKDSTFSVELNGAFYAVHAAFDSTSGELLRSVLILRTDRGTVVGQRVLEGAAYGECDGCSIPTFTEGFERIYRILNVFAIPGFAHPVLLVDTSTQEGRARSLMTFSPGNAFSEFRVYEYTVNCSPR